MAQVGIIGAGIAGLAAAHRVEQAGHEPVVFEQQARPGGAIHSEHFEAPTTEGRYLVEFGPNSLRSSTPLLEEFFDTLGLAGARVEAAPEVAERRYVVFSGRPVVLPASLHELISTELFSPQAKVRLLAEPFVGKPSPGEAEDESVADFARRRLGPEVLDYGINPFTAGVFAGDPEALSMQHAFPRLHALEAEHGSLLGGGLRRAASALARRLLERPGDAEESQGNGPFSLKGGLATLPRALADHLDGGRVRYDTEVQALRRTGEGRWRVSLAPPDAGDPPQQAPSLEDPTFDALVWSGSLPAFSALAPALDADTTSLDDVSYPPVSVVATGFPREAVDHPLDGFGMLVPAAEDGCRTLGTLFSSSVFPHRAPEDRVLLTTLVGGARDPALAEADDETVYEAVYHDLRRVLGAHTPPVFRRRVTWPHAIPQYHVGYGRVKNALSQIEADCPGLYLAGNYRAGVSVSDAAQSGDAAARRLVKRFA
jgi:oxygen-dependent protoporphyrinogen oxidase